MTIEKLLEKKSYYQLKKSEIEQIDYSERVKVEVEEFRAEKEKEIAEYEKTITSAYEAERGEELKACNHYIEVIDVLISDEKSEVVTEVPGDNEEAETAV